MEIELIKKLNYFNIHANLGFQFDGFDQYENYSIAYNNKIKDYWYNFITNVKADSKEEFDKIVMEATAKMKKKIEMWQLQYYHSCKEFIIIEKHISMMDTS